MITNVLGLSPSPTHQRMLMIMTTIATIISSPLPLSCSPSPTRPSHLPWPTLLSKPNTLCTATRARHCWVQRTKTSVWRERKGSAPPNACHARCPQGRHGERNSDQTPRKLQGTRGTLCAPWCEIVCLYQCLHGCCESGGDGSVVMAVMVGDSERTSWWCYDRHGCHGCGRCVSGLIYMCCSISCELYDWCSFMCRLESRQRCNLHKKKTLSSKKYSQSTKRHYTRNHNTLPY